MKQQWKDSIRRKIKRNEEFLEFDTIEKMDVDTVDTVDTETKISDPNPLHEEEIYNAKSWTRLQKKPKKIPQILQTQNHHRIRQRSFIQNFTEKPRKDFEIENVEMEENIPYKLNHRPRIINEDSFINIIESPDTLETRNDSYS